MLKFLLFEEGYVYVNPNHVSSVVETEDRQSYGASSKIAVIHMDCGAKHRVLDNDRTVAEKIAEAAGRPRLDERVAALEQWVDRRESYESEQRERM